MLAFANRVSSRWRAHEDPRGAMPLPSGTLTLLFSDIEGSTRLLEQLGDDYSNVLDLHRRIVRRAVAQHDGREIRTAGDGFFVVFPCAADALRAVVAAQRRHASTAWPARACVRVRIGLHTGEARFADSDYIGLDVHRAARICEVAHGGHVIVSETTIRALAGRVISGVRTRDLGEYWLKDLSCPLRLHHVVADGLATSPWPLRMPAGEPSKLTPVIPFRSSGAAYGMTVSL